MERPKIKTDLANYLSLELKADFGNYENKVFSIITSLYSLKNNSSNMAGWLNLPHNEEMFSKINNFTSKIIEEEKYEHLLVLGIGGSSLGAQALIEGIQTPYWNRLPKGKRKGFLSVDFIDNIEPIILRTILSRLKLNKTLFLVISKTGSTIETIVSMLIAREWVGEAFYKQCVFITGSKGLLFDLGKEKNIPIFLIPENVGGRYSVFSPVGLLPAALCGININAVREGILKADELCQIKDLKINIALTFALCAYFSYLSNRNIFVLMPYSSRLKRFVEWFVQLWAESLGKKNKGSTPLSSIGATDQHSLIQLFNEGPNDKLICFIKINKHKKDLTVLDYSSENNAFAPYKNQKIGKILNIELEATRRVLTEKERPNFTVTLPELTEFYLSELMYILEVATAVTGYLLEVDPFNQPGVELAKRYTQETLTS